jgi:uncharacterized protein (TIGR00290 family)
MLREDGTRSRSHGLSPSVLHAQAVSLGIPLLLRNASWADYEAIFVTALQELKNKGVEAGVFGDIDLDDHRQWEEKVCAAAGLVPFLPLWQTPRLVLLDEFLALGFEATIVVVNAEKLGQEYLGRVINHDLAREFERMGIDPCGEEGEYHTVVTNGPIFSAPVALDIGQRTRWEQYRFLDVVVRDV